ncbi:NAD(P)-dependent oxidoreductase [Microbacterium sp. Marseille-Q6965]|uniref:NAD(P)-dependent oxidoreductase n=1 Tax=Microbacterium sp. Marseille-Q6965 TaxID=2965072 RepID=UPI0021B6F28D|nr:NAD(P)-dependent oxidoreductase [Microbacterium sp. Marseille-Q6965]
MAQGEAGGVTRPAVGFIGLGLMGSAIASRLLLTGPVVVWNRTASACRPLVEAGAAVAASAADVFSRCGTVFLMVTDEHAIDDVLGTAEGMLRDRTLVQMSTVPPAYSAALAARVSRVGGRYVEAPVSGSRQPALTGRLIGLLAGDDAAVEEVEALLRPACSAVFRCGQPPQAMQMKLAVNTFLITLVTGLAESFHFAEEHGLPADLLAKILDAGPMASFVSRSKAAALVAGDFAPHAAIADVRKNAELVVGSAREHHVAAPLMATAALLYDEATRLGHGEADMAAVITAYRARTQGGR